MTSSSEMIKHGDAYIELIEAYPCNNREELCKREGEIMRATENTVNKRIEGRTKKEYRDEHKAEMKQYYQDNIEKIKQYRKEHGAKIIRCECGANSTQGNLARHKRGNPHKSEMEILELANEI